MKSHKERLEIKIAKTIGKVNATPLGYKGKYFVKLNRYFREYKDLTGDDYHIEIQGRGE